MYFLRNICLRSTVIPQARKKHPYTNMYACIPACLPFVFYKPDVLEVMWAAFRSTTVLCLDILWKCYFLILWHDFICCCFPVMFLQPNHVINCKFSSHISADKSTIALLKEKKNSNSCLFLLKCGTSDFLLSIVK